MNHETTLIIGASGLVGRCLWQRAQAGGVNAVGTYAGRRREGLRPLDITAPAEVSACIAETRPGIIYLTAALTHVDYCEEHPEEAWRRNVLGPRTVAEQARRAGAKLVFYSSEYLFDGRSGPYDEEAEPNPLSVYGRTKLEAELAIRAVLADSLILRTTVVYGWDRESKNFAMQVYDRVQQGATMTIPEDQIGTPTLASYLAAASARLVAIKARGVVNVVGKDLLPRSEFARALVRLFGGDPKLVIPVATASLQQPAARPLRGGLRTEKLEKLLSEEAISLEDSLRRLRSEMEASRG